MEELEFQFEMLIATVQSRNKQVRMLASILGGDVRIKFRTLEELNSEHDMQVNLDKKHDQQYTHTTGMAGMEQEVAGALSDESKVIQHLAAVKAEIDDLLQVDNPAPAQERRLIALLVKEERLEGRGGEGVG